MNYNMNAQHKILSQFPLLFHDLGKRKTMKVKLYINEDIRPVAQRHRQIAFHLQETLEKELEALLKDDIIERSTGPTP